MNFREFERTARAMWREIPAHFKEGVDGVVVKAAAQPHPTIKDIYTLGECATETYPSDWGGPETIRSVVVLYHGSFQRLSALDPDFDWEEELWETLTHELRHHLESLATEDALEGVDYAADENFKRLEGEPFDPWFYRSGERLADGVYKVEREIFVEVEELAPAGHSPWIDFPWRGELHRVPRPEEPADVYFLWVEEGLERGDQQVTVVLVRRVGLVESLRGLLGGREVRVSEASVVAERAPAEA